MGSPEFAVPTLEALAACPDVDVVQVVTQPDRAKGRGRTVSPTPVKVVAKKLGYPVMVMTREGYGARAREIAAIQPDVIVVVAFGLILKEDLLGLPKLGCVNLHGSLLPKYRGVSPIQAAILAGDEVTGCTTILMDRGIDTGDMLLTERIEILPEDTAQSLGERISRAGAGLIVRTLLELRSGSITRQKQDPDAGTYTKKIRKEQGLVSWTKTAEEISRLVRAMYPWPTAYTFHSGKRLILLGVRPLAQEASDAPPGSVLSLVPFRVACGSGTLEIQRLKPEGKRALDAPAFAPGSKIRPGDILG